MANKNIKINWKSGAVIATVGKATDEACLQQAEEIKRLAIEYCPLDEGDLRASAKIEKQGRKIVVYFDAPYAAIQHEELSYHHDVGQAKYLERALDEVMPHVRKGILDTIKNFFKRGK